MGEKVQSVILYEFGLAISKYRKGPQRKSSMGLEGAKQSSQMRKAFSELFSGGKILGRCKVTRRGLQGILGQRI